MADSKKYDGVIFLKEWKVLVFSLAPEHQLIFWDLFTEYEYGKVQICENKFVFPVWNFIASQLDDMKKNYNDKIVLRNQQNGQKGGRPNLEKELIALNGEVIPRHYEFNDHFLYIFQQISTGDYKIGETKNLFNRRSTIKIPAHDLQIIHFVKIEANCNLIFERELKDIFPLNKIKGDWFRFTEIELNKVIIEMNRFKKPVDLKNPVGYKKTQTHPKFNFDNAEFVKPEIEILNHLNQVTGRNFKPVESNLKLIRARLEEESPEILKAVIELKTFEWLNDTKMSEYLRPETLFNATKFQGYSARAIELKNNPTKLKLHVEQRSTEARKSAAKHYDPLDAMPD